MSPGMVRSSSAPRPAAHSSPTQSPGERPLARERPIRQHGGAEAGETRWVTIGTDGEPPCLGPQRVDHARQDRRSTDMQ